MYVDDADEELPAGLVAPPDGPDWFAALTDLALITATECGPAVVQPYRSLLDLRYRWRRPVAHRTAITQAAGRDRRLLDATADQTRRQALAEHSLYLTDDPVVRKTLFPPAPAGCSTVGSGTPPTDSAWCATTTTGPWA
ncbi:hypothetical protein AB0F18_20485 [Streptomyces sp. NPDC029216]|uniref:hypothetical protein n=1 Tax=Streptomyces sp. NPDC029216 TaxID=3154701 RepID=UPI00340FF06B